MRRGAGVECEKSTVMFAYFAAVVHGRVPAQRPQPRSATRAATTPNHELDMTPLYGVRKEITDALRGARGRGGLKAS